MLQARSRCQLFCCGFMSAFEAIDQPISARTGSGRSPLPLRPHLLQAPLVLPVCDDAGQRGFAAGLLARERLHQNETKEFQSPALVAKFRSRTRWR
jgi:hypothetical protein